MKKVILSIFISFSCLISYCGEKKDPIFDCDTPEGREIFHKFMQQDAEDFRKEVRQMNFFEKIATFGFIDLGEFYLNPLDWCVDYGIKKYDPLTYGISPIQEQVTAFVACLRKVKGDNKEKIFVPQRDIDAINFTTHKFEEFKKNNQQK